MPSTENWKLESVELKSLSWLGSSLTKISELKFTAKAKVDGHKSKWTVKGVSGGSQTDSQRQNVWKDIVKHKTERFKWPQSTVFENGRSSVGGRKWTVSFKSTENQVRGPKSVPKSRSKIGTKIDALKWPQITRDKIFLETDWPPEVSDFHTDTVLAIN